MHNRVILLVRRLAVSAPKAEHIHVILVSLTFVASDGRPATLMAEAVLNSLGQQFDDGLDKFRILSLSPVACCYADFGFLDLLAPAKVIGRFVSPLVVVDAPKRNDLADGVHEIGERIARIVFVRRQTSENASEWEAL